MNIRMRNVTSCRLNASACTRINLSLTALPTYYSFPDLLPKPVSFCLSHVCSIIFLFHPHFVEQVFLSDDLSVADTCLRFMIFFSFFL